MKSAYELAMERLNAADPDAGTPLTSEQKKQLADIERLFHARLAEREIFLQKQLADTQAANARDEVEKIKQQLVNERARLNEEMEAEKERARRSFRSAKP